jgi:redox-sensitive bicupin YhaK (pirin superfamily)
MLQLRKARDRGHAERGWLSSRHTFSFTGYYDPAHMGFRALRFLNEDRVAPGQGFGAHPHDNMEIISYVIDGQLAHRDSLGNGSVLTPGRF